MTSFHDQFNDPIDPNTWGYKSTAPFYEYLYEDKYNPPINIEVILHAYHSKDPEVELKITFVWEGQKVVKSFSVNKYAYDKEAYFIMKFKDMLHAEIIHKEYYAVVMKAFDQRFGNYTFKQYMLEQEKLPFEMPKYFDKPSEYSGTNLNQASMQLPGMREKVKYPCRKHDFDEERTDTEYFLRDTIMTLNDSCKWTREEIADWLETLDIDLTFKTNTKENENV